MFVCLFVCCYAISPILRCLNLFNFFVIFFLQLHIVWLDSQKVHTLFDWVIIIRKFVKIRKLRFSSKIGTYTRNSVKVNWWTMILPLFYSNNQFNLPIIFNPFVCPTKRLPMNPERIVQFLVGGRFNMENQVTSN